MASEGMLEANHPDAGNHVGRSCDAQSDDDLQAIRTYPQQQRAWDRDDFHEMIEAKTRRFTGIRRAHRPSRDENSNGRM